MVKQTLYKATRYLPTIGVFIYVVLYIVATEFYPGGSGVSSQSIGFDWKNNYWCHLVGKNALNGQKNIAQPYAVTGMIILGISLGIFFKQFPQYFKIKEPWHTLVSITGIIGSFFSMLIMTGYHDLTAVVASFFGSIAIIGIFFGLKNSKLIYFVWTGIVCVLLIVLNGYIYFIQNYIIWFPVISIFSLERKLASTKKELCSFNACKYNASCKALYDRIVAEGKIKKLALIAVCNKLLKQAFAIIKNRIPYDDNYRSLLVENN